MEYLQYRVKRYLEYDSEEEVLNLVINGIPSILKYQKKILIWLKKVLNLVINGIPSIPQKEVEDLLGHPVF